MKKIVIIIIIVFTAIGLYVYKYKNDNIVLDNNRLSFEYGEEIVINENLVSSNDIKIIDVIYESLDLDAQGNTVVGNHILEVIFEYKGKSKSEVVNITVEDTTKPIISIEGNIRVKKDSNFDIYEYIDILELSEYTLNVPEVDTSVVDNHKIIISAKDKYGNESFQEVKIEVYYKLEPRYINGILIVNKKNPLPSDFSPGENVLAKEKLLAFIGEMQDLGLDISSSYSGFRSYYRQEEIYNNFKNIYGQIEADKQIARPGFSEHQSGLTFDLKHQSGELVTKDKEAEYIRDNAARFGFIVRYPEDKVSITGYTYEPWHLRYLGDIAYDLSNNNLALEEYLNVEGNDY